MQMPVIGIVSKYFSINLVDDPNNEVANWEFQRVNAKVNDAVIQSGGLAIAILPPCLTSCLSSGDEHKENQELTKAEKRMLISVLEMCDGVILPGGLNSNPYEEFIAQYCYKHNIPCFGICAGFNIMARALGGETSKLEDNDKHDRPDLKIAHGCKITDPNSFMAECCNGETEIQVNSIHSYVVSKMPNNLSVVAVDEDGYPEAFEAKDKDFFCAVKFHPELLLDNVFCMNMFNRFTAACIAHHQRKNGELSL